MLTDCKIFVAKTAGFCFGVDRAVKIVYNMLDSRNNVVTLGPIIHNPNVVADLKTKGVFPRELEEVSKGDTVVIRSHGVAADVYTALEEKGASIVDATCPFVSRIHKIANEKSDEGYVIMIAGDAEHPEVKGIRGHCSGESYVFGSCQDFENLVKTSDFSTKKVAILAQTTYNRNVWCDCLKLFERLLPDALVYDTICSATQERQREAAEIAHKADIMVIVGGLHSSNTHKLKAVCEQYCGSCCLVEDAQGLEQGLKDCGADLRGAHFIGISAGASTPAYIIKEVQQTMSELLNNVDEEFNFEEELEKTLKKIHIGMKVEGVVTDINNGEVAVDIGTKHTGYIPASEFSDDPSVKPEEAVKVGDTLDLIVLKTNDQEGIVTLSKKRVDAVLGFQKVVEAKESDAVLEGTVTNVVKGGVLVSSNGVKVFVPASQAAPRRDFDLNEMLKQSVKFKILEVNEAKQRAVGSIRAVAREERAAAQAAFFENAQIGSEVEGVVKSITDYGVFVDLGGVDGLVRRMDLSWKRIKHPSDVVSVGDKITVKIKDIDDETKKVSLIYKKDSENPWEIFKANYEIGQVVKATVVSITSFGAFAQIIDGIDGLIHISQIANQRVNNVADILSVGQEVECKITEIDSDKKRISLSIRALLPEEDAADEEEAVEEEVVEADEAPAETEEPAEEAPAAEEETAE
ncbi:MAG: bifunctional 4-hydroxy-3-methylbut-2-enyl diphosphate reductase/30S ribosomal protein S1 [Ruminococcus sp.]|nr:bifunctional 4-hydroxy-3-methylbut-2-enyl diphosphate reductase/30S ribosomal protein S1 [Ruminococcus sp.]